MDSYFFFFFLGTGKHQTNIHFFIPSQNSFFFTMNDSLQLIDLTIENAWEPPHTQKPNFKRNQKRGYITGPVVDLVDSLQPPLPQELELEQDTILLHAELKQHQQEEWSVILDVYNDDSDASFLQDISFIGILSSDELDLLSAENWEHSMELEDALSFLNQTNY
jgi:hypothetical protein